MTGSQGISRRQVLTIAAGGIGYERGSGHRHIDARAGGQGVAGQRKVSGHPEGGATLRKLHSV